jgi:hypothetical protein
VAAIRQGRRRAHQPNNTKETAHMRTKIPQEEKLTLRKYHSGNLIPMFRLAATLCKQMRAAGFTDNGGAIHSAERILNLLGLYLVYPDLSHINNLRHYEKAEFSGEARVAYEKGNKVLIEHVSPIRDFTRKAIEEIDRGINDADFATFVKKHYKLVLSPIEQTESLENER